MDKNHWLRESSDGSLSAYNEAFGECYHSLRDGALNESLYKHVYPALQHIQSVFLELPHILCALDICFGLGYNSFALIATLAQRGYKGKLRIYSPEQDSAIFSALRDFAYPPLMSAYHNEIDKIFCFFAQSLCNVISMYAFKIEDMECEMYIYKGDALDMLNSLPQEAFHIIFQDAFSPKKNPALWSETYFCSLYKLLHSQGIITTYSQSKAIRQNAYRAGLRVYNYESGIVRGGSVMGKDDIRLSSLNGFMIQNKDDL
ncbi:MnmC family methyltransferase [Helicobacter mastomyrinus]|uniref:MnmC family methyltransferase n=1 Tax=Helicobacter mastomyrinus TaxID=287948 RepID=A0ABZ3F7V2_9HELI